VSEALETTAERIDKHRVKLRVEVPEKDLSPAIDAVYRRWASEIKVPGFRKGKVPRQIIDARLGGTQVIREEALRDALPDFYREALRAEELEAVAAPEIDVIDFEAGAPLVFEATVDVRPEIELPDPAGIEVQAPTAEITEAEVDEQLERLRDRFAELETVPREARRGDFALIDLKGYKHERPVEGAGAPDLLYELGSNEGPPSLDAELEGNRAGAILKFTDSFPEGEGDLSGDVSFTVLLKEVKAKKLPSLDDDFAKTVGEFDSLDDLKADLRNRLGEVKDRLAAEQLRAATLEAYVDAAGLEPPDKLVDAEFSHRLEHFQEDLKKAGLTFQSYCAQLGKTELEVRSEIRGQSARSIAAELLLEELARSQDAEVTEEDIGREIATLAARMERDPKEVAEQLVSAGRLGLVAADIMRRKALDYLVTAVKVKGRPADSEEAGDQASPA
jgi:trigger factor